MARGEFYNRLEHIFLWPLFGAITTALGVIAGYLGAHFDKTIWVSRYPFCWPGTEFSLGASIFWLATSAFGVSFMGTFWAQARSSKNATDELKEATTSVGRETALLGGLVRRLHTLPPRGYLEQYREAVTLSEQAYHSLGASPSEEELAAVIRTQLICALRLAAAFDEDGKQAKYGCNIMLFRPSKDIPDEEVEAVEKSLLFTENHVSIRKLPGALEVITNLSVCTDSEFGPDPSLKAFYLPVPYPPSVPGAQRHVDVLPGAPDTFVNGAECIIESPDDLERRASPHHFTAHVREQLHDYLSESSHIQSFFSLPLYNSSEGQRVGVLNLHRDRPNPLSAEKFLLLFPLLTPIINTIQRLVCAYTDHGNIVGKANEGEQP